MFQDSRPKLNNWILPVILFLIGAFRFPAHDMRSAMWLTAELGVYLSVSVFIFKQNGWIGSFLILTLISSMYPQFGKWSYLSRNAVVIGCLWYAAVITVKNTDGLLKAICLIGMVNCFFIILQIFGINFIFIIRPGDITGIMANRNETSSLIALCLPAYFQLGGKWLLVVPFVLAAFIPVETFGGVLAVIISIGVISWFALKSHIILLISMALLIIAVVYALFFDMPDLSFRPELWSRSLAEWFKHPLTGYGIGHYKFVMNQMRAHNDVLQAVVEMGIVAGLIMIGYTVSTLRSLYRHGASSLFAAFIIILVLSLVSFPFHIAPTAIIAVTWMAIFEIAIRERSVLVVNGGRR